MERLLHESEEGDGQEAGAAALLPRGNKADVDLVRSISAGMVLKGYFLTKDKRTSAECKQTILQCPESVTLIAPTMSGETREFVLTSKTERSAFQHALRNGGHSVAASLQVGYGHFKGEASASYKKERSEDSKSEDLTKTNFASKSKVSFVPTKAFTLNENDYKLSPAAVKALIDVETSLDLDKSILNKRCELFFEKFGSHFYKGTYHFGGICERSATVETADRIAKTDAMDLCKTELDGKIGAGFGGFISGDISRSKHSDDSNRNKHDMTTSRSKVKIEQCIIGGPQEANDFVTWKQGLVSKPDTWYVIDRDAMTSGKYEGIWKLIVNTQVFKDPLALALTMMESWEQLSGLKNDRDISLYADMMSKLVVDLKSCEFENDEKLLRLLQKLDNVLGKIKDKFKADEFFSKVCDDNAKDLLQKICKQKNAQDMKHLAGKLLDLSKARSTSTKFVEAMIRKLETLSGQFRSVEFSDVQGLKKLQKDITEQIKKSLQELHDNDTLQFIFVSSSVSDLGQDTFDFDNLNFRGDLSQNDVNILIKNIRSCLEGIDAFDKTIRGIFDANSFAASLEMLHKGLRNVWTKPIVLGKWVDYLSQDIRTQNVLEAVARNIHEVGEDRKTKMLRLFTILIMQDHGIRLRRPEYIISHLEKAVSCEKMVKKLRGDLAGLPVRLVEVGKMNVRMKGDKEDCGITGIDVTPDGNILLADAYNDNVKQFSRSGELLSHCSDIVEPVKVFSTSEAAFIHPLFRPKILIVNLTNANRMSVHGFITIKERQSIDDVMLCSDTNFIFGCCKKGGYSVKRIDMHGKEIWTKVISVTGRCHLTRQSSDTGDRVIIADYKKERLLVLAADTGAELIVHPTKQAPRLVTSDDGGRVYVYYNETGELVVLSADLKVERSLGYGMRELEPEAIVCDRKCGELLVSSRTITHRNHLYRFRIEKMSDSF